jgi:hypothetical protein
MILHLAHVSQARPGVDLEFSLPAKANRSSTNPRSRDGKPRVTIFFRRVIEATHAFFCIFFTRLGGEFTGPSRLVRILPLSLQRVRKPPYCQLRRLIMIRNSTVLVARESTQTQIRPVWNFRLRILAAFRALGHGFDARTAQLRMHAFYRSSGADWARCLP